MKDCFIYQHVLESTFQVDIGIESNILDLVLSERGKRISQLKHYPPLGGIEHGHHALHFDYYYQYENSSRETMEKSKFLFNRGKYEELSKYFVKTSI